MNTNFKTDLLDEFCMKTYGHTNWYQIQMHGSEEEEHIAIVFVKEDYDE
jgi:hypothetical protein